MRSGWRSLDREAVRLDELESRIRTAMRPTRRRWSVDWLRSPSYATHLSIEGPTVRRRFQFDDGFSRSPKDDARALRPLLVTVPASSYYDFVATFLPDR